MSSLAERISRHGPLPVAREIWRRRVQVPAVMAVQPRLRGIGELRLAVQGRRGLEVGGPSHLFRRGAPMPLYDVIDQLDMINYAQATVWEGALQPGAFVLDGRTLGRQHICEASEIDAALPAASYDYVLSSNCLEHVANPLKALAAWLAVLKPGGLLILALPDKRLTFDRRRPDTTFAHLLADLAADVGEDDETHHAEILALTDLALCSLAHVQDHAGLVAQTKSGAVTRCNHHHIFSPALLRKVCDHFGLDVVTEGGTGMDYIIAARK